MRWVWEDWIIDLMLMWLILLGGGIEKNFFICKVIFMFFFNFLVLLKLGVLIIVIV